MENPALVLYVLVPRIDKDACVEQGALLRKYVQGDRRYIGLRERPQDALERLRQQAKSTDRPISVDTHCVLEIRMSTAGFAHYGLRCSGRPGAFAPVLQKMVYAGDTSQDWKVWHFLEDIPLAQDKQGDDTTPLVRTRWHPLTELSLV